MSCKKPKTKKAPVEIGPSTFQVLAVCLPLFIPGVFLGICAMYAMITEADIYEFVDGCMNKLGIPVSLFGVFLSLILIMWDDWKIRKRWK